MAKTIRRTTDQTKKKWAPRKKKSFTEATEPELVNKVEELKKLLNYREEKSQKIVKFDYTTDPPNPIYKTQYEGSITVEGVTLYLINDDLKPVALHADRLGDLGSKGAYTIPQYNVIHIPASMVRTFTVQELYQVILHEVAHNTQLKYVDKLSAKAANNTAKVHGISKTMFGGGIHGDPMKEIDADIQAARWSDDPDGYIKALEKIYNQFISDEKVNDSYSKKTLQEEDQKRIEWMMDQEYAKLKKKVSFFARLGSKKAKDLIRTSDEEKYSTSDIFMIVSAMLVMMKFNKGRNASDRLDPGDILWNTKKYHVGAINMSKEIIDPNGRHNQDFIQRKKALELAKKRGMRNPFLPAKEGETEKFGKVLDGWDDDYIPMPWIRKNKIQGGDQQAFNTIRQQIKDLFQDVLDQDVKMTDVIDASTKDGYNHSPIIGRLRRIARELLFIMCKKQGTVYKEDATEMLDPLTSDETGRLLTCISEAYELDENGVMLEFKMPKLPTVNMKQKTVQDAEQYIRKLVQEVKAFIS